MNELKHTYGRMELAQLYFPNICGRAAWRKLKEIMADDPALKPLTGIKRRTFSWESNLDGARAGLVFVSLHKTDGSSIRRDADEATLLYSVVKTQ